MGVALIGSQGLATKLERRPESSPHGSAAGRLWVGRLTLSDFRCYGEQRLEADSRPIVITGPNGAGKTNLLEAVSFLVPGRGLRGARLAEVGRRQPPGEGGAPARPWAVAARLHTPAGTVEIGTGIEATAGGPQRRVVHIDGRPAKSQAALAEHLSVLWLTPRMDRLFAEGATARRRFLDRLVFGLDPAHAGRVSASNRAMGERTRLLGKGRHGGRSNWDPAWLAALEDTMTEKGVAVAAARREAAARLNGISAETSGPFPGAVLEVRGMVEDWLDEGPALAAEDRLRQALAASRKADAESGGTGAGPHKSDLKVRHLATGQAAGKCSTGEQKALLIAIVLANARIQAAEWGAPPLLLLDEVVAHLDRRRREALFEEVAALGAQAWLSGTDAAFFSPLKGKAQFFGVKDAAIATLAG